MSTPKGNKMLLLINYRMRVTLHDARVLVGRFMAFDKHMNIVLGDCEEFRVFKPKGSKEEKEEKRTLGLTLVRGECVVSLSVEGPPPKDDSRIKAVEKATTGPGTSAAAGRGVPPPPPGSAPLGLSGPARGVGGPSAAQMAPRPSFASGPVAYGAPPPPMGIGGLPPPPPMHAGMGAPPPMMQMGMGRGMPPPMGRGMPPPGFMPPPFGGQYAPPTNYQPPPNFLPPPPQFGGQFAPQPGFPPPGMPPPGMPPMMGGMGGPPGMPPPGWRPGGPPPGFPPQGPPPQGYPPPPQQQYPPPQ